MSKYWCKPCKCYVVDSKLEKSQHEKSSRHKHHLSAYLTELRTLKKKAEFDTPPSSSGTTSPPPLEDPPPKIIISKVDAPSSSLANPSKRKLPEDWQVKEKSYVGSQTFGELTGEDKPVKNEEGSSVNKPLFRKRKRKS